MEPHTHPRYEGFFPDVGVVVLGEAVSKGDGHGKLSEADLIGRFQTGLDQTVVGYGTRDFETGRGPQEPTGFAIRYNGTVEYLGANGVNNGLGEDRYTKTRKAGAGEGGESISFGDSGALLPSGRPREGSGRHLVRTRRRMRGAACAQGIDLPVVLRWVRTFP